MSNRYVDFVSDENFLECIKWVCSAYPNIDEEVSIKQLQKNTIDPFKMVFDMLNGQLEFEEWKNIERMRQKDKTINNRIGEFHQKLLGKVEGWEDLKVGHPSRVDLKNNTNTIFIEIKNKHNTINSDGIRQCRIKLEIICKKYPEATCYWAFIVGKKGNSGEAPFRIAGKADNPKVKMIWGKRVYEVVTGDPNALDRLWKVLPLAIKEVLDSEFDFDESSKQKLSEMFIAAFGAQLQQEPE